MKSVVVALLSLLIGFSSLTYVFASRTETNRTEINRGKFVKCLQVGQAVSLKPIDNGYEIMVMDKLQAVQKVLELGEDYVVIEDAAGFVVLTIPVYQIRCIRKIVTP